MKTITALSIYEAHNAASIYCIGFKRLHDWFFFFTDTIRPEWVARERTSGKNAGKGKSEGYALRLRLHKKERNEILEQFECFPLSAEFLALNPKNKGNAFETYMEMLHNGEKRKNDNVPFWMDGDGTINGVKVQYKVEGAQVVNEYTIERRGWA